MDINNVSQVIATYENSKPDKANEKKTNTPAKETKRAYDGGKAAEYKKSEEGGKGASAKVGHRDSATIQKMMRDAEERTSQLRSLVEKMMTKQGQKFTSLADAFSKIEDGTVQVDEEVSKKAQEEIGEDGYWGVKQTSERLFSFAKALAGNDPRQADKMLSAIKKGYEQATKSWGKDLPDLCKRTLDATEKLMTDWRDGKDSDTAAAETSTVQ